MVKGKKRSGKPKRPVSAYMFFVKQERKNIAAENPGASFAEVGKLTGARWKSLNEEERRPFDEMAQRDRLRYEEDKKNAPELSDDDDYAGSGARKPKRKRKKKREGPKRAITAFFFFSQVFRPKLRQEHPEMRMGDIAKILGKKWGEMTDEQKETYVLQAEQDKQRYANELQEFQQRKAAEARLAAEEDDEIMETDEEDEDDVSD